MGEKTVVHIFAEEFIEINRMFFRSYRQCSKEGSSFSFFFVLFYCCCPNISVPFLYFFFPLQEYLSFEFSAAFH